MKYIIRYGEIGIKSPKIRRKFENTLLENIKTELDMTYQNNQGRITIKTDESDEHVHGVLGRVFGIVSYSPIMETETKKESIEALINTIIDKVIDEDIFNPDENTFAVKCRRVGTHDFTSQEMAGYCGSVVVKKTNAKVNLSKPDFTLYVEVRDNITYMYHEKIKGLGGLPVGSQGRVICLISGGIDSPVAAYNMLKRGCSISLLHCDNDPYTHDTLKKVVKQARNLQRYSLGSKIHLYTIHLGKYLEKMKSDAPPRITCVLCKSGMYQSAAHLAKKIDAKAIVDGSSIGQVASQTLNNIEATRYHCKMPIFSPLISMDKIEIEAIAKDIGSYEISIVNDSGCSAVPRYPETHADLEFVNKIIEDVNQKEILEDIYGTIKEIEL